MAGVQKIGVAIVPEAADPTATAERGLELEELGRLWDIGLDSGPAVDSEEAWAILRQRLAAKFRDTAGE